MISSRYPNGETVQPGDRVVLDGVYRGVVDLVLSPQTAEAKDFSCFDTGGLLINTADFGLMLVPFGSEEELERAR